MVKKVDDSVLDAALSAIATSTNVTLCSAEPVDYAGIAAVALGSAVVDNGDFSLANGDTSGRKLVVAAQSGIDIVTTGDVDHIALDDGTTLLAVTDLATAISVTAGNTADLQSFDIEFADPV